MHTCPQSIERPWSDVGAIIPDPGLPEPVKEARRVRFAEEKNQVKSFKADDPIAVPEIVIHHQKYVMHKHKEGQMRIGDDAVDTKHHHTAKHSTIGCRRPTYYIEILVILCIIATALFFFQCPCYSITIVMIAVLFIATYGGCVMGDVALGSRREPSMATPHNPHSSASGRVSA